MGLLLYPIAAQLPGRHLMRLDIEADVFLKLLSSLDGKRRFQAKGLPKDVRCVGLTVDQVFNTVSLHLESPDWPEVPSAYVVPRLDVTFFEWSGDAQPGEEAPAVSEEADPRSQQGHGFELDSYRVGTPAETRCRKAPPPPPPGQDPNRDIRGRGGENPGGGGGGALPRLACTSTDVHTW